MPQINVDVMRQTRTSIDNVLEHTLNDSWNHERKVLLSEEWIGATRFRIQRKTQEEIAAWRHEETRLQDVRRKRGMFDVSSEDRIPQGDYVVPSMPCIPKQGCSRKPDAMPIFERSGTSVKAEGSRKNDRKRIRVRFPRGYGA